jgi:hypothetical protein
MRKCLVFISTWALFASFLITISPSQAAATTTLTTCISLKSATQYLAKDGKCNERIYESATWYQSGSVPLGTPGSKRISISTCQSKTRPDLILLRNKCNPKTQITTTWHRPLGPPAAPSIVTITAGLLGTATVATKAPTNNGGARITTYSLAASPTDAEGKTERANSTFRPNSSGEIKISGLIPGATYTFTLIAHNAVGASASSQASAPFLAPTVPAAPAISAVVATGTNSALITYTAPAFDGGSPVTSYTVTSIPGGIQATAFRSTAGTIDVIGLISSTSYTFTIVANNFAGSSLPSTISTAITTFSPPPPPAPAPTVEAPTPTPTLAAPAFTLSSSSETRTANISATGFTISSTGGAIASFAINATPAGMSFSTSTGALTGTPTSVAAATAYTVTATNATGFATRTFTLTVEAALAAPAFTLSSSLETRTVNIAATGFTISSTGGLIASFAINATPAGMSFSTSTGALTGTPTSVATATAYTITATNATGSATQAFTLTVEVAPALPAFTLSSSSETKTVNVGAAGFTVTSTGGTVASYSITPTPVASMSFNTSTGRLSGWTGTVAGAITYTVTATNSSGTATRTFVLTTTPGPAAKVGVTRTSAGTQTGSVFSLQPQITIQDGYGNTVTSSSAVVTATTAGGATLVGTDTATASSGIATFVNLGISGTVGTSYTVTYTAEGLTVAKQVIKVTDYVIGSTGPGGGKIFYIATAAFSCGADGTSWCTFLEAAKSAWNTGNDPRRRFAQSSPVNYQSTLINNPTSPQTATATAIGSGYYNTLAIILQGNSDTSTSAAALSDSYTITIGGVVVDDWYLPSHLELQQLYGQRTVLGDFQRAAYWSSTAYSDIGVWAWFFDGSGSGGYAKSNEASVRPIRSF